MEPAYQLTSFPSRWVWILKGAESSFGQAPNHREDAVGAGFQRGVNLGQRSRGMHLYLNPTQKALVLCLDEKSPIQALDRTQPGLPLKKGRCGMMTHDYNRHGTTTLFAALNVLDGQVIGECHARHRHQEWMKFLRRLDREYPPELTFHLIMDNYGTHKEPHVRAWLQQHPRFVCHFIPTSSSWLNLVERWFAELSEKAIRRGSFVSVPDLRAAMDSFLAAWNVQPQPFIWTAKVDDIMAKIERARSKLEQIKTGCTLPRGKNR